MVARPRSSPSRPTSVGQRPSARIGRSATRPLGARARREARPRDNDIERLGLCARRRKRRPMSRSPRPSPNLCRSRTSTYRYSMPSSRWPHGARWPVVVPHGCGDVLTVPLGAPCAPRRSPSLRSASGAVYTRGSALKRRAGPVTSVVRRAGRRSRTRSLTGAGECSTALTVNVTGERDGGSHPKRSTSPR